MRRTPAHAVDRPGLRALLDGGLSAPLSCIVAPAGSGKTVLLSQWVQSHPEMVTAWPDAEPTDADALVWLRRLTDAVAAVAPRFRAPAAPVVTADGHFADGYLAALARAFADAGPLTVVFDDLDRLNGTPVLTELWDLVDLLPPGMHFVFASRTDLHLRWSRRRLQYSLVEIRQDALAFDVDTTARVLERLTGRPVAADTAAEVTARTEGWPVGVQLTALSMRAAPDPERVVETMSGTDRLVMDYLSEEVLDGLDPSRRTALLRLAVLDEACPALAEAVTGENGEQLLVDLERDSMFIVPVAGRPGWYRLHRLFRDLLLLRLRAHDREEEAELLAKAARWYHRDGDAAAAIEYSIRARRWDDVIAGVLGLGRACYDDRRMATVARWLGEIPAHVRVTNLDAEILLGIAEEMSGQAANAVDRLRTLLETDRLSVGQRQIALAYLSACVQFDAYPEFFLKTARRALTELAHHPRAVPPSLVGLTSRPLLIVLSRVSLGRAQLFLGDIPDAHRSLTSALSASGTGYRPFRVHTLGSLAMADALAGRLVEAAEHADEALDLAREAGLLSHPAPADAHLARAVIAVQRGEPAAAAPALNDGAVLAAANRRTQLLWLCWLISTAIEDDDRHPGFDEPSGPRPQFVRETLSALTMRRARLRGAPIAPASPAHAWSFTAFEEIAGMLTTGNVAQARARLAQLHPGPADDGAPARRTEYELLQAWLCMAEGRHGAIRDHLVTALRVAEPEWLVHPFVRVGPEVAELVDALPGVGNAFRRLVVARARASAASAERPAEGLTPRERELLAYLPTRLTIADIGARCFVSTNTVKTHLSHIYRKLDVQGRDAAVDRANELGLIDSYEAVSVS